MCFIDGDVPTGGDRRKAAYAEAEARGWDKLARRSWGDRACYHPPDPADYGSTVGMPIEDGEGNVIGSVCVGCWWCEGPETFAHAHEALWTARTWPA